MVTKVKKTEGDVQAISNEFRCFHKSSLLFSSHHKRMINRYPEEWVAVYNGKVKAHDIDYYALLSKIDRTEIPRELTIIRYITRNRKSMIL